tara:strand:- start:54 stop:929 length:876 start_codon:yes stop_codon:yes gene_type:complete
MNHTPPWIEQYFKKFDQLIRMKRLPHGLLISAAVGWGSDLLAEKLLLRLLGESLDREIGSLAHPDMLIVSPAGLEIKLDSIREVINFSYLTPQIAEQKVILIKDADCLNVSAGNALLKTLEEPPLGTYLILCTTSYERLLPTIRSRCHRYHIRSDYEEAYKWLADRTDVAVAPEGLSNVLRINGPLQISAEGQVGPDTVTKVIEILNNKNSMSMVDELLTVDMIVLTSSWYRVLLDMITNQLSHQQDVNHMLDFEKELGWARTQLIGSNSGNTKLLLERLAAKWDVLKAHQ